MSERDGEAKTNAQLSRELEVARGELAALKRAAETNRRLLESAEQHRTLLREASDATFCLTAEGRYSYANPALAAAFGTPVEEIVGKSLWDFFPKQDADRRFAVLSEALRTGASTTIEGRVYGGGRVGYFETLLSPVRDATGRFSSAACSSRDITDRRRTEQLLAVRLELHEFAARHPLEELLQKTLDEAEVLTESQVGFYHFVEADQRTLSLQAWSTRTVGEFCKAAGRGMHYPIDAAGVWADAVRQRRPIVHNDYASLPGKKGLPEGHAPVIRELVVPILRNGAVVAIMGVGNKATEYTEHDERVLAQLAGVASDISERTRVEEALRASERALRFSESKMMMAEEIGHAASWVYDLETAQVWGSAEGLRMFGYPPVAKFWPLEEIEGCIPDRDRVHEALVALISEGREYDLEYEIHPADGSPTKVLHSVARIESEPDGRPVRVVGFVQDVTQQKVAERRLRRLAEELSEANRLKDVFTDVLRHDILNPVGAIKLSSELLLRRESDEAKIRLLERMRQSALNLVEMTENAAKLASITAGAVLEFAEADPARELRAVALDFEHQLLARKLTLTDHAVVGGFTARFHPILKDVFANLLSNAIKYCPEGTRIDLGLEDRGDSWIFSVRDQGPGVPDVHKQTIFSRFERLEKSGVKGSGLGLSITKQIVASHGGEIWVEDAPQGGCVFVVRLPKDPPLRASAH
jgi:PAS domain S-box-containing protein